MIYEDFGKRVHQQRKLARLTQEGLAEKAKISASFMGHIERGTRKASVDTLIKLCNALNVAPGLLLQDSLNSDLLGQEAPLSTAKLKLLREISNSIINYSGEDAPNKK